MFPPKTHKCLTKQEPGGSWSRRWQGEVGRVRVRCGARGVYGQSMEATMAGHQLLRVIGLPSKHILLFTIIFTINLLFTLFCI